MRWWWLVALGLGLSACDGGQPTAESPSPPDPDPEIVQVQATPPPPAPQLRVDVGDLDAIKASGQLRVLVMGGARWCSRATASPRPADRELAALFAQSLGVAVEPVAVDSTTT